ncbi:MAG: glycosyltransferase family 4 protein [Acidobacteriota bacterium]|nr:glycosyltransferase family 4 protein [Acidobacteriota bacterium]
MLTLHVDTEHSWRGGQRQVFLLVEGLVRRGAGVTLAAPAKSSLYDRACRAGIAVVPLSARNDVDPFAIIRLARLLRRERFDILHCHTARAHGIALLAQRFVPVSRRPEIVVSRRVIFASGSFLTERKFARVGRVIAVSEAVKQGLVAAGVDSRRIAVVRDGIPLDDAAPNPAERDRVRRLLHLAAADRLVLNVAHLGAEKGQSDLIAAAAQIHAAVPNTRIAIVGGGKLRGELERQAAKVAGGRILFAGFWPPERIAALLAAAAVFVLPSRQEGLGSVLLDAMAAGVPVVAASSGGIPEIVRDGVTGLLFPPGNSPALAEAVIRLLKDPPLATRLASAALDFVRKEGSADRMVEETLDNYRSLLPSLAI